MASSAGDAGLARALELERGLRLRAEQQTAGLLAALAAAEDALAVGSIRGRCCDAAVHPAVFHDRWGFQSELRKRGRAGAD